LHCDDSDSIFSDEQMLEQDRKPPRRPYGGGSPLSRGEIGKSAMTQVDKEFCWWRDPEGYKILKGRPDLPMPALNDEVTSDTPSLLSCIGTPDTVLLKSTPEPFLVSGIVSSEPLYMKFANIKTEDDVLTFCNLYGVPTDPKRPAIVCDDVLNDGIINKAQLFRQLIDAKRQKTLPSGIDQISALIAVGLFVDASGKVRRRSYSANLLNFMMYQVIQAFDRGIVGLVCPHCGRYFEKGPGSGRRRDSKYCTEKCRLSSKDERTAQKRRRSTGSRSQRTTEKPNERTSRRKPTGLRATHE
jgi:hypothetical protein